MQQAAFMHRQKDLVDGVVGTIKVSERPAEADKEQSNTTR